MMASEGAGETSLLLGQEDLPPVHEHNAAGRSPFLLTCDHYGRLLPRALGDLGVAKSELTRHIAWDIGIAGVAEALSDHLGAHLIAQRYSRLVIDCNRPPGAPSSIPMISEATTIPGNEGILFDAAEARRREIFDPYHHRIDEVIERPFARPCADGAGGAAQLHAGLCRDRAALAYRHALPPRHHLAAAVVEASARARAISWSATTSPMR